MITKDGKIITVNGKGLNFDSLVEQANEVTGKDDKTVRDAVQSLCDNVHDPYEMLDKILTRSINGGIIDYNATLLRPGLFARDVSITYAFFMNQIKFGVGASQCSTTFYGCANLQCILFPNSLKDTNINDSYIGQDFASYTKLKTVVLNEVGAYMEARSFSANPNLITFILTANSVQRLPFTNVFNDTPISRGTGYVYVPDDLVDEYKNATTWTVFANQIKGLSDVPIYDSATEYTLGSIVKNEGKTYVWINLTNGNVEPTGAVQTLTDDWYCVAEVQS